MNYKHTLLTGLALLASCAHNGKKDVPKTFYQGKADRIYSAQQLKEVKETLGVNYIGNIGCTTTQGYQQSMKYHCDIETDTGNIVLQKRLTWRDNSPEVMLFTKNTSYILEENGPEIRFTAYSHLYSAPDGPDEKISIDYGHLNYVRLKDKMRTQMVKLDSVIRYIYEKKPDAKWDELHESRMKKLDETLKWFPAEHRKAEHYWYVGKPETLEDTTDIYTLNTNGKPLRAQISHHRTRNGENEQTALTINYLHPGTDEKAIKTPIGNDADCAAAASFHIHAYRKNDGTNEVDSGAYWMNGRDKEGTNVCGERTSWTEHARNQQGQVRKLNTKELTKIQKLFDYAVKTVRGHNAGLDAKQMSSYVGK